MFGHIGALTGCSGLTCSPEDLPVSGTIHRNHNKEPYKGRSFRLQVRFRGSGG